MKELEKKINRRKGNQRASRKRNERENKKRFRRQKLKPQQSIKLLIILKKRN